MEGHNLREAHPYKRTRRKETTNIIAKWQALVTPQEPAAGSTDKTALILYNSGATPLSTTDINFALARKTLHDSLRAAAVAQFVNPKTDLLQQKRSEERRVGKECRP